MDVSEQNARIDELNKHPINLAALEAMRRANQFGSARLGSLRCLHVLTLASLALPDEDKGYAFDETNPDNPWMQMEQLTRCVSQMEAALRILAEFDDISPEALLTQDIRDAAKAVLIALGITVRG